MSAIKLDQVKLKERAIPESARAPEPRASKHLVWKIVGGAVVALVAAGVITSLHDIRRYIRIRNM